MNKKIFDILPPGYPPKVGPPTAFGQEKPSKPAEKISSPHFKGKKYWEMAGGILAILILAFLFCYFTLSKAEIEIWPETESLTFETKATIDSEGKNIDVSNKVIPGKTIVVEKTVSEEFPSSGKILKEKKAEGIIRVYNAYSTSSQALVSNTRFISAEGKLFRSLEKVTIPGGKYEGGKLVPGELDVKVVADQSGPEYNITATTFSIPGFAGTAKYTKFYGKSSENMTGGLREKVPQVTQDDLYLAQKTLEERALKESDTALKEKISSDPLLVLLKEAQASEILETFSLARPKEELEKFNFQVKAKSEALVFNTKDVENFIKDFILSQIPESKKLHQESLKTNYLPETINLKTGKIILSLKAEAKIYSDINQTDLKRNLGRKSLAEAKIFLENQPHVTKTQVRFWPFWVKKVPEDADKIEIKLRID